MPLEGEPDRAAISRMGQLRSAGIREVNLTSQRLELNRSSDTTLPPTGGLLALDGDAILTSLRQIDNAIEARLFNPSTEPCQSTLRPDEHLTINRAQPVDNESRPIGDAMIIDEGRINLNLGPKQILTLSLDSTD